MTFDIASDSLLTIEDICSRLSISRRTFDRMRGEPQSGTTKALGVVWTKSTGSIHTAPMRGPVTAEERELDGAPAFPKPTCFIGRSPRWAAKAVNAWIAAARCG